MSWKDIKDHKKLLIFFVLFLLAVYVLVNIFYLKNGKSNNKSQITQQTNQVSEPGKIISEKVDVDDLISKIKSEYKQSPTFQECIWQDMGIKTCLSTEVSKKVSESGNTKYCADLLSQFEADSCVLNYVNIKAMETGDVSYCSNLLEGQKQNCVDEALISKAKKENKISICDSVSEFQISRCKESLVIEKARKSLKESDCNELEDGPSRDMCKTEIQMVKDEEKFRKEEELRMKEEELRMKEEEEKMRAELEKNNPVAEPVAEPAA